VLPFTLLDLEYAGQPGLGEDLLGLGQQAEGKRPSGYFLSPGALNR
jgi:hypothetical protein